VIVLSGFDLGDEVTTGIYIWDDCVFKFADFGFKSISAIEEDNIIAALFNEFINCPWLEMNSAINNTILINLNFVWRTKCD